jgi:putative FmdB family regulatory protein
MPMYEYECSDCKHHTEVLRPMKDADAPTECEKCLGKKMKRLHSVFAATTGAGGTDAAAPMSGCGRCGDPRGSCSLN